MRICRFSLSILCAASLIISGPAFADKPEPTHKDVAYDDDHESQMIDVYLAESDSPLPVMIHIHGGGWQMGSKTQVPAWLMDGLNAGSWHVVSVEYRFTDVAPHPAQAHDCLRAIQFVRYHAQEWKIDPERVGVTGGSAGGHLSMWVALHDDAAQPDSGDPVERQSSRVACAVSFAGPTDWSLLKTIEHTYPGYRLLVGGEEETPVEQLDAGMLRDVSPVTFVSEDDPPIMQVHGDADKLVPIEHARNLHAKLMQAGVTAELVLINQGTHAVAFALPDVNGRAIEFVKNTLLSP